jgi:hypothetical protein
MRSRQIRPSRYSPTLTPSPSHRRPVAANRAGRAGRCALSARARRQPSAADRGSPTVPRSFKGSGRETPSRPRRGTRGRPRDRASSSAKRIAVLDVLGHQHEDAIGLVRVPRVLEPLLEVTDPLDARLGRSCGRDISLSRGAPFHSKSGRVGSCGAPRARPWWCQVGLECVCGRFRAPGCDRLADVAACDVPSWLNLVPHRVVDLVDAASRWRRSATRQ